MSCHDPLRRRRILLLGATGQVGGALVRAFGDRDLTALDRKTADLSRPESLRDLVRDLQPSVILNSAAYTAVDRAESEPELADTINHQAPRILAEEAERAGALLVHYSTDYVFDGSKGGPWIESDAPAPLNAYGRSKLAGEAAIVRSCRRHIILRTSWVYGARGSNFLRTMLRLGQERPVLKVVNDQWGAPTSSTALAEATCSIVDQFLRGKPEEQTEESWVAQHAGIYHATCAGKISWCEFAAAIFEDAAARGYTPRPAVEGIPGVLYPTPARRPHNSALSNEKLYEAFRIELPHWEHALAAVLDELAQRGWPSIDIFA